MRRAWREQSERVSECASGLDHLQCEAAAATARNGTLDALSGRLPHPPPSPSCSTLHLRFHLQPCRHLKPHLGGGSSDLTRFCAFTACPAAAAGGGCCPGRPRGNRGWGAVSIGGRGCNTGIGFRLLEYESQTTQCNPSPRGGWWLLRKRDSSHEGRGAG